MKNDIPTCEIIGIDIAKSSFAVHGADRTGVPVLKAMYTRSKLIEQLGKLPGCRVYMEACGGAHHLGRVFQGMGHEVGLIPPIYVKPFLKRQKNDANDAAAIVEAASRATMRVIAVKEEETQALASVFRSRELLVKQRTQTANSIRGLLTEFGVTVPKGIQHVAKLRTYVEDESETLPETLLHSVNNLFAVLDELEVRIRTLTIQMRQHVAESETAQRLMEVPGIGPITAYAMLAFAGDLNGFRCGREFAAWLGLTPKEHSTGGKHTLGSITKMGQTDLRHLLVSGAMTLIRHHPVPKEGEEASWIDQKLLNKPKMVVAVALANRMARVAWSMIVHNQHYDPTKCCIG